MKGERGRGNRNNYTNASLKLCKNIHQYIDSQSHLLHTLTLPLSRILSLPLIQTHTHTHLHSTELALLRNVRDILTASDTNQVSILTLFDMSAAFDTTDYSNPEGRQGMFDVSPLSGISGLSFDSTLLSPLLFFCLVLLLFLSYLFSACWSTLLNFFQRIFPIFFCLEIGFFVWLLFSS